MCSRVAESKTIARFTFLGLGFTALNTAVEVVATIAKTRRRIRVPKCYIKNKS